jgi:uncharacterized protein (TIGR00725 family)
MDRRLTIGVIGDATVDRGSANYILAENLGRILIDHGYRIANGGMSGIMEAVCKGAKSSEKYVEGMVIGILPGFDPSFSNQFVDVVIATGLDTYRNAIVANSDVVVAMGGQAGTLSEMAYAWTFRRMLIAYDVPGWSGKLAGTKIDNRKRIDWEGDVVFKVSNEMQVIELISKYAHHYTRRHNSILTNMKDEKLEI